MKATTILLVLAASLAGGAVGALIVTWLDVRPKPPTQAAQAPANMDRQGGKADTQRVGDAITDLQAQLERIEKQLADAREERKDLRAHNEELQASLERAEAGVPANDSGAEATTPAMEAEVDRAVQEALEKAAENERVEKAAATRRETEGWMGDARDNIVRKLDEKLLLTQFQRDRIGEIMQRTTERIADLMVSGAGKSEDGREQWNAIWQETTDAIRNELGSAQHTTYDELVGERGIVSIAWEGK